MFDWIHKSENWTYILLGAAAVAFLAVCWLALRTGRRGSAGLLPDVALPLVLAGATLGFLPEIMSACGVVTANFQTALEGLLFRSVWLGLLLDQTSWVQRTTRGLRGRRASLPTLVWGLGFMVLMLAPLAALCQNSFLAWLEQQLDQPDMRDINMSDLTGLLADWGLRVAQCGVAFTLVGAFALAMQAVLWLVRIGHAYAFTQPVEPDEQTLPPYAPGCFQSFFGVVFGAAGAAWLVWSTAGLLQGP
jgi:hypothetical protein